MKYHNYLPPVINSRKYTEFLYENLNEGLITTYDINKCKKHLMSNYPEIFDVKSLKYDKNNNYLFYKDNTHKNYKNNEFFEIKIDNINNLEKIQKTVNDLYGWFVTRVIVYYKNCRRSKNRFHLYSKEFDYLNGKFVNEYEVDDTYIGITLDDFIDNGNYDYIDYFSILFEAKFTIKNNNFHELYHLTDINNLNRIRKYGLIPKSNFNYNERIYFSPDITEILDMIGDKFANSVLLRLNLDEYENNIKCKYTFYEDPRAGNSFFTYDTINPKYIQIFKNNNWENLV